MKIVILFVLFLFLFTFCHQPNRQMGQVHVPRDSSITSQNAASDLFLDSTTMEKFLNVEVKTDTLRQRIRNFYNNRNYAFAWFNKDGLTVQAEGFWNIHDNYLNASRDSSFYDRQLHGTMEGLFSADSLIEMDKDSLNLTELRLTKHFFEYVRAVYGPKADPEEMEWHIPTRKLNASVLLDSLLEGKNRDWRPLNSQFYSLRNIVLRYRQIQNDGGWSAIEIPSEKITIGTSNGIITKIKKRLSVSNNYAANDTSVVFNDSLLAAINIAQQQYGLPRSTDIDAALIKALNVPVEQRIKQMLLNMERMKWLPEQPMDFIMVNIPSYRLRVFENGKVVLAMDVVVGKAANRTVIFSDSLKYVVFSPYWNVPRSIVRNETYPAMKRSSSYLGRNNMEVTGYSNGLPIVRQKPGPGNALGQVKFIFPNSYNIYFHDTPSKSLFSRNARAFSHGCIRLHQPFELARYLLRNDESWTDAAIKKAMNASKEKWVTLKKPLPVFITYFTSWVDSQGIVQFRDDVYGHDKKLERHLFE